MFARLVMSSQPDVELTGKKADLFFQFSSNERKTQKRISNLLALEDKHRGRAAMNSIHALDCRSQAHSQLEWLRDDSARNWIPRLESETKSNKQRL
jgi:hypothetical protein